MTGWIREDVANGKLTPEAAAKAFDQLGASPEQRAPDTRSEEIRALDAQYPRAKETDFNPIQYYAPG